MLLNKRKRINFAMCTIINKARNNYVTVAGDLNVTVGKTGNSQISESLLVATT
jgi:ATP-dependent protease HslVU (ClpYQ) peptidase subunit